MIIDDDEFEVVTLLHELDQDWVADLKRLSDLKAQKIQIELEISYINQAAAEANLAGKFTSEDGTIKIVKVRHDDASVKVDLEGLKAAVPYLANKIMSIQLDTKLLKDHIKRGFFTNTPAESFLIRGKKSPWVQITTLSEENDSDE